MSENVKKREIVNELFYRSLERIVAGWTRRRSEKNINYFNLINIP